MGIQPVDEKWRKRDEEEGTSQWMITRNPTKYLPQSILRFVHVSIQLKRNKNKNVPQYTAKMCKTLVLYNKRSILN